MSVDVPYQWATAPAASRIGSARVRNQRYPPSRCRSRSSPVYVVPAATAAANPAPTRTRSAGWMASFGSPPAGWPVYSAQRRLR